MTSGQKSRYDRGKRRKKLCEEKGLCFRCNQPKEQERMNKTTCDKCAKHQALYNKGRYKEVKRRKDINMMEVDGNVWEET